MNKRSRQLITFALVCLFVLIINTPVSLFAIGEYNGIWVGPETVTIPGYESITETTATPIYQENENTLYVFDPLFGATQLEKSDGQWVLPSPIWTTFMGYEVYVTEMSITFHSSSYLTGSITVELLGVTATASLSHTKQSCQSLTNGSTISGISGGMDSVRCYNIDLPSGATNLNVQTWGGSGDCDLCLIYHRPNFDFYISDEWYNQEQITLASPDPGKWYIILYGWESYSGLNLSVSYDEIPVCGNGIIEAGEECDDGNTLDGDCCSATCQFEPLGSPCPDPEFCNGEETCDGMGSCQAGTPVVCNDDIGCTDDSCNEVTDACDFVPNDANCPDDGLFCNGTEYCDPENDCSSTGDPCPMGTVCNEATESCEPIAMPWLWMLLLGDED